MKNVHDPDRLRQLLGTTAFDRIRKRLCARLRRAGDLRGRLILTDATELERNEVDALFGRRPTTGRLIVDLEELDRILRDGGIVDSLVAALEALEGPVLAEREALLADEAAWSALIVALRTGAPNDAGWIRGWCEELIESGLLRRLSRGDSADARRWMEQARAILLRVPFSGVRLALLAAEVCGDSHALDDGEPLGTILGRGVEHALALVDTDVSRREALAKVGIVSDDTSAPVLVLNFRGISHGLLATTLNRYADAGEPLHVTARQLQQEELAFELPHDGVVFACENPTVLATAADVLGRSCPPLMCTSGQVRNATRELLRRVRHAGARILYHGDFDWPGITIARGLYSREDATPWRMRTADYHSAADGPPLQGRPTETPWDPSLAGAMVSRGRAVHEEAVLGTLLDDLGDARPDRLVRQPP